ncbi:MAG: hypothetical protein V1701_01825 [Planctomycetota bacterium]
MPFLKIDKYSIPREILRLVPEDMVKRNLMLPISKIGKVITVGMINPQNTGAIEELKKITGCDVKAVLCKLSEIKDAIKTFYGESAATSKITEPVKDKVSGAKARVSKTDEPTGIEEFSVVDDEPVIDAKLKDATVAPKIPHKTVKKASPAPEPVIEKIPAENFEVVPESAEPERESVQELTLEELMEGAQTIHDEVPVIEPERAAPEEEDLPQAELEPVLEPEPEAVAEAIESPAPESVIEEVPVENIEAAPEPEAVIEFAELDEQPEAIAPELPAGVQNEDPMRAFGDTETVAQEAGITYGAVEEAVDIAPEMLSESGLIVMSDEQFAEAISDSSGDLEEPFQRNKTVKAEIMAEEEFDFYRSL